MFFKFLCNSDVPMWDIFHMQQFHLLYLLFSGMNFNTILIFTFFPVSWSLSAMLIGGNTFQFFWYQSSSCLAQHLKNEQHLLLGHLLIALKTANGFAKHSKINLSFWVALNFENCITTFRILFANFLEGRPMTVISILFVRPLFTIFSGKIIADAISTAGFSLDSYLVVFSLQLFLFPPQQQNRFPNTKLHSSLAL